MPTRRVGIIRAGNEPKASGRATTKKKYGAPHGVPHMHHPLGGALMHAPRGHAYGHPKGAHWSR